MPFQHFKEPVKEAIASGAYAEAFEQAKRLDAERDLAEALEVVLAAAEGDEVHFDALAVRWIVQLIEERQTNLYLVHWTTCRLLEHVQLHYRDYTSALRRTLEDKDSRGPLEPNLGELDQALRERNLGRAWQRAGAFPSVPLDRALRLVLLLADRFDRRYESAARRFLARIVLEIRPEVIQIKKLADCLAHVHHGYYGPFARESLKDVIGQLERMEAISIHFARADDP